MLCKVAVTGGLSCGKTAVCRIFEDLGAYVVGADEIVHQLLNSNIEIGKQIISLLGSDIIHNNQLDRSLIAKKVFNQPQLLQQLEKILHPAVWNEIETLYQTANTSRNATLFIAEIPLLFETGAERLFDFTIVTSADEQLCIERFMQAAHGDSTEYKKRMACQMNVAEKEKRASFVIKNNGSREDLYQQVYNVYKILMRMP